MGGMYALFLDSFSLPLVSLSTLRASHRMAKWVSPTWVRLLHACKHPHTEIHPILPQILTIAIGSKTRCTSLFTYQLTPTQNLNFPDSEYATTPLAPAHRDSSNSYSSSSSSSVNGIRVFPKKVPARRPLPGSQHPRVRTPSTPASSTSSIMSVSVISADVAEAEANCYDANHNKFMQLNIGTGPNCDGYVLTSCFPLPVFPTWEPKKRLC